jgi:hypothetical protein
LNVVNFEWQFEFVIIRAYKYVVVLCYVDIFLAIFLAATCMCCIYVCSRIFPDGPIFSPIELDDIRIGRVHEAESGLQQQIEGLQGRLAAQRMKRTNLETQRDIAATVEDRVEKFNAKGQSIYGDAWDEKEGESIAIKELVTIPETEIREMRIEAQNIVTSRKADEEKDLWNIWNKFKDDPNKKDAGGASGDKSPSGVSSATAGGQPDVLTGRTSRAKASSGSGTAGADPRFSSGGTGPSTASAAPKPNISALPPPRSYVAPPPQQNVNSKPAPGPGPGPVAVGARGARPPPPGALVAPGRGGPGRGGPAPPRGSFSRQPNDEKEDDDYDNKIHSSFHSPPPRSLAERVPLLAAKTASNTSGSGSGKKPPPPVGPPPGWRGGQPPTQLAPLTGPPSGKQNNSSSSSSSNPMSPPMAPPGVLPPRGTPPPAALKGIKKNS